MIRIRFSKRDQLREDRVRRLKHVTTFPEDCAIMCAVQTDGVRNNPISKRDTDICNDMIVKSKHIIQGKRSMPSSDPINIDH